MIRYSLKCPDNHVFESWFQSADAYEALRGAGMVSCPECGATEIEKAMMTPQVRASRNTAKPEAKPDRPLSAPADPREAALAELKRQIEAKSDYVGMNFVAEARAIHEGDAPARSIHGEARVDEAKKLLEDGVPVAPLPFTPKSKTN